MSYKHLESKDFQKDEDAVIVDNFLSEFNRVYREMENLKPDDKDKEYMILGLKLGKVFKAYKDILFLTDFEGLRTYYNRKFNK